MILGEGVFNFTGNASFDWNGPFDINKLCEKLKIDLGKYEPVGISIFLARHNFFSLSIFLKEKDQNPNEMGEYPLLEVSTGIKRNKFFGYEPDLFGKELTVNLFENRLDVNKYYVKKNIPLDELK